MLLIKCKRGILHFCVTTTTNNLLALLLKCHNTDETVSLFQKTTFIFQCGDLPLTLSITTKKFQGALARPLLHYQGNNITVTTNKDFCSSIVTLSFKSCFRGPLWYETYLYTLEILNQNTIVEAWKSGLHYTSLLIQCCLVLWSRCVQLLPALAVRDKQPNNGLLPSHA